MNISFPVLSKFWSRGYIEHLKSCYHISKQQGVFYLYQKYFKHVTSSSAEICVGFCFRKWRSVKNPIFWFRFRDLPIWVYYFLPGITASKFWQFFKLEKAYLTAILVNFHQNLIYYRWIHKKSIQHLLWSRNLIRKYSPKNSFLRIRCCDESLSSLGLFSRRLLSLETSFKYIFVSDLSRMINK